MLNCSDLSFLLICTLTLLPEFFTDEVVGFFKGNELFEDCFPIFFSEVKSCFSAVLLVFGLQTDFF